MLLRATKITFSLTAIVGAVNLKVACYCMKRKIDVKIAVYIVLAWTELECHCAWYVMELDVVFLFEVPWIWCTMNSMVVELDVYLGKLDIWSATVYCARIGIRARSTRLELGWPDTKTDPIS